MTRRRQPPRHCHGSIFSRSSLFHCSFIAAFPFPTGIRPFNMRTTRTTTEPNRSDQARMGLAEGLITPRYVNLHGTILYSLSLSSRSCFLGSLVLSVSPVSPLRCPWSWVLAVSSLRPSLPAALFLVRCSRLSGFDLLAPFCCGFLLCYRVHTCLLPFRFLPLFASSRYLSPLSIFLRSLSFPLSPLSSLSPSIILLSLFSTSLFPSPPSLPAHSISLRSPNLSLLFLSRTLHFISSRSPRASPLPPSPLVPLPDLFRTFTVPGCLSPASVLRVPFGFFSISCLSFSFSEGGRVWGAAAAVTTSRGWLV